MSDSPHAFGSGIASLVERQANDPRAIRIGPPFALTAGQHEAAPSTPQKVAAARSTFAASPLASSSEIGAAVGGAPRAAVPAAGVPASSARVAGDFDTPGRRWRGGCEEGPQHAYDHDGANGSLAQRVAHHAARGAAAAVGGGQRVVGDGAGDGVRGPPVKARSIRTEAGEPGDERHQRRRRALRRRQEARAEVMVDAGLGISKYVRL